MSTRLGLVAEPLRSARQFLLFSLVAWSVGGFVMFATFPLSMGAGVLSPTMLAAGLVAHMALRRRHLVAYESPPGLTALYRANVLFVVGWVVPMSLLIGGSLALDHIYIVSGLGLVFGLTFATMFAAFFSVLLLFQPFLSRQGLTLTLGTVVVLVTLFAIGASAGQYVAIWAAIIAPGSLFTLLTWSASNPTRSGWLDRRQRKLSLARERVPSS